MADLTKTQLTKDFVTQKLLECPICSEDENVVLKLFPCQHFTCASCAGKWGGKLQVAAGQIACVIFDNNIPSMAHYYTILKHFLL